MGATGIEWADVVWNPVTGCSPVSEGCRNCYAARMAKRLQAMAAKGVAGAKGYEKGFEVTLHPERLEEPLNWKKPRRIFVCSMADIFHEEVRLGFIKGIYHMMARCERHTFLVLTKRPKGFGEIGFGTEWLPWPRNVWSGVSVESGRHFDRIHTLRNLTRPPRFISFEPLLSSPGFIYLGGINWVIVGGESGPGARPMEADWARSIRDQCRAAGVPFFMKQMGGVVDHRARLEDMPEDLRVREFPKF